MVVDSVDFGSRLERLGVRHNPMLVLALNSFASGVRRYWVTSTVFGLIVSTLTWVGLAAYGIPLAIVWAVLAFVTNYIPNIGFVIGLVPAAVMGLLAKGPWGLVFVVVLYAMLNFVIQGVLQPKVAGEAVGVTSTVSFLSLLVWAVVLGPLGALLALPATLFVKALVVDADPKARWVNALIASNPRTSSEEPMLVAEETAPVAPPPAEPASADADRSLDEPRYSLGDQPAEEAAPVDEVAPRHSADPVEEEPVPVAPPGPAVVASTEAVTAEREPVTAARDVLDGEPQQSATTTAAAADLPDADVVASEEAEPVGEQAEPVAEHAQPVAEEAEEADPQDVPRRARLEADPRGLDEEPESPDGFPVFQKSATPYWTGASRHAED